MHIIFHHPLPLDPNAKSASGIRPQRMLQAFKDLGYEVDLVTGYAKERKAAIKSIKEKIKQGVKYDFVYAESSTMPTTMTEPHHLPIHPFLDFNFFSFCKKQNIPIGLFYRDIYWLFEEYDRSVPFIKALAAKIAYRFDLWVYERTLSKLYLPSEEMGAYVPTVGKEKFSALPPGHRLSKGNKQCLENKNLELFFVGGFSNHYQLHVLFEALVELPEVNFTLCTREDEWLAMKHEYPEPTPNIKIIHEIGVEMENHLKACDVAVLFVKPQEYREFASPVKLYEYVGFQKPILASEGTLAGTFVKENKIGWSLPYRKDVLKKHLKELAENREFLEPIQKNLEKVAPAHSWLARAEKVTKELTISETS